MLVEAGFLARRATLDETAAAYLASLGEAHRQTPIRAAVPLVDIRRPLARSFGPALVSHVERTLSETCAIRLAAGKVALVSHDPLLALDEQQSVRMRNLEEKLRAGGTTPPDPAELILASTDNDLIDLLTDLGRVARLHNHAQRKDLLFHADALREACSSLAAIYPSPTLFRTGEAREALATSRKFIVPILEYFDVQRWTVRNGDLRVISAGGEAPGTSRAPP